jgi:hypothetical protein
MSGDTDGAAGTPAHVDSRDEPAQAAPARVTGASPDAAAPDAAAPPTAARPSETRAAKEGDSAAQLGEEQVEARDRTKSEAPATLRATVIDFDFVGYQRLLVQLDNGQIWRQIDGDRTSVERDLRDETSFDVEMWGTALGGYRMRILALDRTIRVERLK